MLTLPNAPTSTVALGTDFTLAPGESVLVDGAGTVLTFLGVPGDSRCPTNALIQCVWAGSARVVLRAAGPSGVREVALESGLPTDTVSIGQTLVRLRLVTPARLTLDSIPAGSYRATLLVTRKD